jgi:hypothetical protein
MPLEAARAFVASLPWRQVRTDLTYNAEGKRAENGEPPHPHSYVILEWPEIAAEGFWGVVNLIRDTGYLGAYSPPYDPGRRMVSRYLDLLGDGYVYWHVHPNQLCRTRIEDRQHKRLPEQIAMEVDR